MPIEVFASNSPWNDKTPCPSIESWDPVEVHVRFDQPIVHELEYVDKDVTLFWVEVGLDGLVVSRLATNRVLPELQDEARTFRNGRFRFALSKQPDALSQHFHAAFPKAAADLKPGRHAVTLKLFTDNQLQEGKVLAEGAFTFEVVEGSADHLKRVAEENEAQGADKVDDAAQKAEHYTKAWAHRGPEQSGDKAIRVKLVAREDVRVRLHQGGGRSMATTVQKNVETDWHEVAEGSSIDLLDGHDQRVRSLVTVQAGHSGTTIAVG